MLSKGKVSNIPFQRALEKYGIENFSIYIVNVLDLKDLLMEEKKKILLTSEQQFIDRFPKEQLYNLSPTAGSPLGLKWNSESLAKRIGKPAPNKGKK